MQKIFRELFKQFVAKNGVEPKGIELLQMKFKANELKRQADKVKVVDFEKTPTKVRPGREATVNTLKTKSDDVAPGTLQAEVENLKVDAEDLKNQLIQNKNKLLDDLDTILETGGQPFKKKDNSFLGGSMHEEGQIRTGIRMFLQDELKNGRLKLNADDKARVMEYFPTKEDDPILVFKRIYGDDAYEAAGKFPGAFEKGEDFNHYREIFKENMDESYLKVKTEENLGDGTLMLTDEVITPIKDEDVPFAGGGVVKKIIKSITMKNKDPMDSMKELNEVLKRRKEFDLTDSEVDEIMEAGNEWIFQRDPDNLFVPTKDKPKTLFDDEVQVFKDSEGGIKGITMGGDKKFKKGIAEAMEEGMRESENMKRLGLDPTSQKDYFKYEEMKKAGQMEKNVTGSSDLSAAEELRIEFPGITDEMIDNILMDTNQQRIAEVKQTMREALEMQNKGMNSDQIIEVFTKTPRSKNADGGRPRSTGLNYLLGEDDNNRVPYEDGEDFKQFQKEKMMQFLQEYQQYLKNKEIEKRQKPFLEERMGLGLGPILEAAQGGIARVPYATGGRRGFLKLLAGLGAAGAAFKSGLMSLKGGAKPIAKEIAKETATGQPPAYFLNLVAKIKTLGDDTPRLATQDRQKVTTYKDYTLTEDVTTGQQEISRMKVTDGGSEAYYGNPLVEETYMSYKPGKGLADETTKGKAPPDEYEEGTAYIRSDRENAGEVVDESFEISDEVIEEGTKFEDNLSDFGKADGGRAGYKSGLKVKGSGSISGKQDMYSTGEKSAIKLPEGITSNESFINLIANLDIPISEQISLLGDIYYNKSRKKIEKGDKELFLEDPASSINRKIGIGVDTGTGITGSAKYGIDDKGFLFEIKKSFAAGGIAKLIKKLNDIAPGSTKLGATSKKMNKKMSDKRALQQAIRDFEKRTKTPNPLGLSEEFIRGLNKKVKKQMGE